MTKKQEYILAFLDGYFETSNLPYGMRYFAELEKAEKLAKKKWKQYKSQKL